MIANSGPLPLRDLFTPRARALFFARLAFDALGVLIMVVPAFAAVAGLRVQQPYALYWMAMLIVIHVVTFLWVGRPGDRTIVFLSLCFDLLALVYLVTVTGGLRSPMMQGQLVYTVLFAIIFPTPLAILPPLLTLPIVTKIEQLIGTQTATRDFLLLLWYTAVNVIVVYVVVSLSRREEESYRELDRLQQRRRRYALVEERNRIAREMHDGLGAVLSSIVIQAEYVLTRLGRGARPAAQFVAPPEAEPRAAAEVAVPLDEAVNPSEAEELKKEMRELRRAAQEGMEELRRAVSMMREDFDLVGGLEDMCGTVGERTHAKIEFASHGTELTLEPYQQLACYRILQEALSNAIKHAASEDIRVELTFGEADIALVVVDRGRGFDPNTPKAGHYGLQSMQERARRVGGELRIDSAPGDGTRVSFSFSVRI